MEIPINKIEIAGSTYYTVDSVSAWLGYGTFEEMKARLAGQIALRMPDDYLRVGSPPRWVFPRAGLNKLYNEAMRLPEGRRIQERLGPELGIKPPPTVKKETEAEPYGFLDDSYLRLQWEIDDIEEIILSCMEEIADAYILPQENMNRIQGLGKVKLRRLKTQLNRLHVLKSREWKKQRIEAERIVNA